MINLQRSRGRPATFDKESALETAIELFIRHGYDGTSIAMLTDAMGVTSPTLYKAFSSKEQVYAQALAHYQFLQIAHTTALYEAPITTKDFADRLMRASAAQFAASDGPQSCLITIGSLQCAPDDGAITGATRDARLATLDRLTERISQGKARGDLPDDCDEAALARFVTAIIQGIAIQALDGAEQQELERIIDLALVSWPNPHP